MNSSFVDGCKNVLKLFRFLFWYGIAVAGMFYLLPLAGALLESRYDEMSGTAKLFSIIGFLGVVGSWHALGARQRAKRWPRHGRRDRANLH